MSKKLHKRGGIAQHETQTTDADFDQVANGERVRQNEQINYYRALFAWEDPVADKGERSSYKFLHHAVADGGDPGEASIRACIRGIAALNSASGGEIPEEDRQNVWNHLAKHMRDASVAPPPMRSDATQKDLRRVFKMNELRIDEGEGDIKPKIRGHAAVFNSLSVPIQGFRETIQPGAFRKTILESDIRALWNHDERFVLGRNKAGTLKLEEDSTGLRVEIDPPDTQFARDFVESIRRGDVDQMSFGFNAVKDRWFEDAGEMRRELLEVRIFDVSPVTFPAYEATDVSVRSVAATLGVDDKVLGIALRNANEGKAAEHDLAVIESAIEALRTLIPNKPTQEGHLDGNDANASATELKRKRLNLLDIEIK